MSASTTTALRLQRLADQAITGWMRYVVLAEDEPVGFVVEWHDWQGHRYGPRRWYSACNRTGELFRACWRSPDLATRRDAVEALAAHLGRCS